MISPVHGCRRCHQEPSFLAHVITPDPLFLDQPPDEWIKEAVIYERVKEHVCELSQLPGHLCRVPGTSVINEARVNVHTGKIKENACVKDR